MIKFSEWLKQHESSARTRAAMSLSNPPQAGLVFAKPPYSAEMFCKKIKAPGVKTDNMNTSSICHKNLRSKES